MFSKIRQIKNLIKSVFICTAIMVTFLINISPIQLEKQALDFKSAVIISIGFSVSICMMIGSLKKE